MDEPAFQGESLFKSVLPEFLRMKSRDEPSIFEKQLLQEFFLYCLLVFIF